MLWTDTLRKGDGKCPTTGKKEWEKQLLWPLAQTLDGKRLYAVNAEAGKMLWLDLTWGAIVKELTIPSHRPWVILGVR